MRAVPATLVTAIVVSAGLLLGGCGDDDDPSPEDDREALVDELAGDLVVETGGALSAEQARCVAERLADDVGVDRFVEVVAAADQDRAGGEGDPDLRDQVIDAFAACDALEPVLDRS